MKKTAEVKAIETGRISESFAVSTEALKDESKKLFSISESKKDDKDKNKKIVLKPRIECIHAGMTRNKTFYSAEKLKGDPIKASGVYSWTNPYPKPMIKNHDSYSGDPTGRIESAVYITNSTTNKESIVIIPTITDPDAIEKVLDGRYMTVSIGATTDSAICSICGTNLVEEGWCGHFKGEKYDDQECYWIIGDLWFDECSWVNVPADQDAQVVDKGEVIMAEAFAESDGVYYDLSKEEKDQDFVLTEQVAETYGLVTHKKDQGKAQEGLENSEEGEGAMNKPKKGTKKGEEVTKPDESLDNGKEPDTSKESAKDQDGDDSGDQKDVQATDENTSTVKDDKDSDNQESDDQDSKADSTEENDNLAKEVKALKDKIEELENDNQTLLDSNAELSSQLHKLLVERVVDMRISLNKTNASNREEAINELMGRTKESLEDSLKDLSSENGVSPRKPDQTSETVENPAGGAVDGEKGQTIESDNDGEKDTIKQKALKEEDVLMRLFSGKL